MSISQRSNTSIWHPYTYLPENKAKETLPIAIVKGQAAYLFDDDGNKYIDAISSWWVNIHGHAHPYIAERVSAQLLTLEHVIFAGFTHQPAVELSERLLAILPFNQARVFYSDNGSTAVEVAIKMALQYWSNQGIKKTKIIAFEHAYHGDTFGSMSVSARSAFNETFASFLFDVIRLPLPQNGNEQEVVAQLQSIVNSNNNQIAAFIFEPLVLGAGGMLMYEAEVLDQLVLLCKQNNILCIADEVMTGFGRTGKLFASNYLQQQPDIFCLSKGLTGGTMPMGITTCSANVFSAFVSNDRSKTFYHGHSYTANPLACTAALASLDLLLGKECLNNIERISLQMQQAAVLLQTSSVFKNIRYCGTILAVDIETKEQTSYFNSLRDQLYYYFLAKGVLLRPLGNTVYIMPPYCILENDLQDVISCLLSVEQMLMQS